jgi:hypothetical protein
MAPLHTLEQAIAHARSYLAAMETRRLQEAQTFLSPDARITFPGGRVLTDVAAIAANSGNRYRRVAKNIQTWEGFEASPGTWVVYCHGTLYGDWGDGAPFEGIRFIDRFEIGAEGIRAQHVWNDAGEAKLARLG